MKRFLLIVSCFFFIHSTFAQQTIKGKVVNEANEPINAASVYLVTNPAKAILKTAVTNEDGEYTIVEFPKGTFQIEVTAVGYDKIQSETFDASNQSLTIPNLTLAAVNKEIEAVTVRGELPLIQNQHGKLVMNVENSSIAAGNNALEVLKRAPGVVVDKDDNITLMGQQGVNVTIDGRQTYMTGEQLATFLKSTDGAQIKSIELSTTRSAKDDAEGAGGVINITMKKNRLEGFNGTFIASAGHGKHFRGNSSLNLNYKKNNTTLFGNYAYTNNKAIEEVDIDRIIQGSGNDNSTLFSQDAEFGELDKTHNYKVGIEQKTSDRNIFMVQFSGVNNIEDQENPGITSMSIPNGPLDSLMVSDGYSLEKFNRYSFNANNEFKIDTLGKKLTADIDYSFFKTKTDIDYAYHTYFPDMTYIYDPEYERSNLGVDIKIFATKVDYTQPMWKGNVETGLKFSSVNSKNDFLFENKEGNVWVNNMQRSNMFDYTEEIAAAYFDYSTMIKKWGIKAGLRGEYTFSDGVSVTQNKQVKRDYLNLFPSAALSYNLSENHVFSISYARKVTRPNYRNLNPFEYYVDKRTYQKGNPYLNPQFTDGFAFSYSLFKRFNIALGHDITTDAIVESIGQDDELKTTWITKENLGKQSTSYLNLTIPYRIGKVWSMFNNLTGIYMHFNGAVAGYEVDAGSLFFQGNSTQTFKINKQLNFEVAMRYNSKFIYNLYEIQPRFNTDVGMTYNFKDERSSLKLAVTDVFHSNHNNVYTNFEKFDSKIRQYGDAQTVRLTFNYKFGNLKQAIRRRDNSSEEKERAM